MNFKDIIGQTVLVNSLQIAVNEGKVSNGYILYGPKGCGKKLTAFVFAQALNCKAAEGSRPCGVCASCIRFQSGNHPNIEIIAPTGASIKIKQIRQVISDISKKSFESGYKVIVLDQADKMTQDAQDAFLKTLEEPPGNTVFILLAENQYALLPTVISRCQVYPMKKVANQEVEKYLKNKFNSTDSQIKLATAYANGIIGRAIEIIQNEDYFKKRNLYISILEGVFAGNYLAFSTLVSENLDNRAEAEYFLNFLLMWFRDIMIIREISEEHLDLITNMDRIEDLRNYSQVINSEGLNRITDIIKKSESYIKHNVGIKNCLDGMLLNIMEVCNGKDSRR